MDTSRRGALGRLALIGATLLWGSSFVVLKTTIDSVPTLWVLAIRFTGAAILMGIPCLKQLRKIDRGCLRAGALMGVMLFAAYTLAKHGYAPLVFERGGDLDERDRAVAAFWDGGALDPDCNIQFGEGGAGAYSDGKLTTRIGDPLCETVLETLAAHGAPDEIVKKAKPHVGTDILKNVVRAMRRNIVENGGEVHFRTALTGVSVRDGALCAVRTAHGEIACERAVAAIGHSARDTFAALHRNGVYFEPKAFSVGVRIEHLQSELDRALYGKYAGHPLLTLKCDPLESELLRAACPDILPGFYTDKRTWISIRLDGGVERERILRLCDASYDLVFARLTRRARMEIMDGGT